MTTVTQRPIYRFADLVLDLGNETLRTTKGASVTLRPKSFALLRLLVENLGRLVTREMIMEVLWPNVFVTDDSITQCVLDVRKALGDQSQHLKTVRCRGYVFEPASLQQGVCDPAERPGGGTSFGKRTLVGETTATGACYTGDCAALPPSVLLLPLKTSDESEVTARIADSLTEEILGDLTQHTKLLMPPAMRIRFHDNRLGRPAVTDDGSPVYVLRGNVRSQPATELSLQLLEPVTGACIWAIRSELTSLASRGARLVEELTAVLFRNVGHHLASLPARDLRADDFILQAHALLLRPRSMGVLRQALWHFERAFAMDPESNGARLGIANVLVNKLANGWSTSIERDEARADALLRDVFEFDADIGLAYGVNGTLRRLQGRLAESKVELEIAMELAPDHAMTASQLGWTLFYSGELDGALRLFERGVQRTSCHAQRPLLLSNLGTGRLLAGDTDAGIDLLLAAAARIPAHSAPLMAIAAAFGLKSDAPAARAALQRGIAVSPALRSLSAKRNWIRRQGSNAVPIYERTMERGLRRAGMPEE